MHYDELIKEKAKCDKTIDMLKLQLNMMSERSEKINIAARMIKLSEKVNVLEKYWAAPTQEEIEKIKEEYTRFCADVDFIKEYLIFESTEPEPTATIGYTEKRKQIICSMVQAAGIELRKIKILKSTREWIIAA